MSNTSKSSPVLAGGAEGCPCGACPDPSRRTLLRRLGWGALFATLGVYAAAGLRFLFPHVLFEPPATFRIGTLDDYPAGTADEHGVVSVSEKFMEEQRVWIVRETDKLYAIFGKCTHLGCTPKWFPAERQAASAPPPCGKWWRQPLTSMTARSIR